MSSSKTTRNTVASLLARWSGVLKLRPNFVHRFYPDLNRLGQKSLKTRAKQSIPERWIGSSVCAINPPPLPAGGLSMLEQSGPPAISLRDAIKSMPQEFLGDRLLKFHGPEFRVLAKILDPGEAIVFHLHATDQQVRSMPAHFRGHRFGKDEAYYFLEAPKGPMPYTHVGLHPGVTRKQLVEAVRKGREYALELSPVFYQEIEQGFFVPAGIPHRPGTALTLEIQQPSDVYTLLETHSGGEPMRSRQLHPGFKSLEEALELIDLKASVQAGCLMGNRIVPRRLHESNPDSEVAWIFPPEICRKFGGKRLRISRRRIHSERIPFVLFIWRGSGTLDGRRIGAGDEFMVTFDAAKRGIELVSDGREILEAFIFFPA